MYMYDTHPNLFKKMKLLTNITIQLLAINILYSNKIINTVLLALINNLTRSLCVQYQKCTCTIGTYIPEKFGMSNIKFETSIFYS